MFKSAYSLATATVIARAMLVLGLASGSALAQNAPAAAANDEASAVQPPKLTLAFEMIAEVAEPVDFGIVTHGRRRVIEITGGTFEGPRIKGRVVPGGADWQMIQSDGFSELDTRYALETDQGELIYVQNFGLRHAPPEVMERLNAGESVEPELVYFRTLPRFETSSPRLQWLARSVFVGTGERYPNGVLVRFWLVE